MPTNPMKLTGLTSMGLPGLAALHAPRIKKIRALTIQGLLNKKVATGFQGTKMGLLTGIPKTGQGLVKQP
jgi:hypothetical protein